MKRFALFFLILILFLNTAFALDFIAAGDADVSAYRCYIIEKEIFASNPESSPQSISLAVGGSASSIVKFSEINFVLSPDETKAVTVFYDVPCDFAAGSYNLDIYFTSSDAQKILSQKIEVLTPDDLFITVNPQEQEIKPCGLVSYEVYIDNPTSINESYS